MKNLKFYLPLLLFSFFFFPAKSQEKNRAKIQASTEVVAAFSAMKEGIPKELFAVTEGIIIIPSMKNAGLGVAGKRGKGIAMVKNTNGTWSNPVFVTITGASVGLQAGYQSVDLVLIFKNKETLQKIGRGSFTLGGDVSVTAGPVGRNSTASTDYKLDAEAYSYSKAKGLFAGISLSGSSLDVDEKANTSFYKKNEDAKTLFASSNNTASAETKSLQKTLRGLFL
ncbi:MAG: hypothetical protein AVDCRST_MAG95-3003 [uncultured Adhaeribacter sp.]|uniref:Ysc84 actin-binding domain-containing protein n=1 Tax=uncultured Adhaeribacter sp. TaxID=448109 RepID=A0A6J4JFP2_9BACT|nr:MAG: hypothetical protein AVDCRST_MAG95-3003 [uncultured Adhaeribacter sp.]